MAVSLISKFKPLFQNDTRYFVLTGGRGSAKSFHVADFLLKLSYEQGHTILFTRYTMISAHLSVIPEFTDKIDRYDLEDNFDVTKAEITNKASDSLIVFKGIKTSSGNQTAALKSLQGITTWVLDEAEELVDENIFDKIDESVRVKDVQNRVIIILNPTIKEHWIYKRFFEGMGVEAGFNGVKDSVTYIHTTYFDNIENISQSIIDKFEKLKLKSPKQYNHRVLGGWLDSADGLVYENYRQIDSVPIDAQLLGYGMDFGFSNDPAALVAVYRYNGTIIVDEIVYRTNLINSDLIKLMSSNGVKNNVSIWADSAEPKTIEEIKRAGYLIRPVEKGADSIRAGIRILQDLDTWFVTTSSVNLLKELRYYCWDTNKDGAQTNKPIDMYNHALDALRYFAMMELKAKTDFFVV
jgi:phage terminase large subunit